MNINQTEDTLINDCENSHQSNDVIDLVGNMFQTLANNNNIPDSIGVELAKLQTPYLKIAQETPNLFRLENHSAKLFLNAIVSMTIKQHSKNAISKLYIKKTSSMVNEIVNINQYDNKLFIKLQNDLEKFIQRQIKRSEIKIKREQEKQQGLEKINRAKQKAKKTLEASLANKKLPNFVKAILIDEWYNVLVLYNLRYNPESLDYQENLEFVKILIENTHSSSSSTISEVEIIALANRYKKGLELVAFNPLDSDSKSENLVENLNLLIKSRKSKKLNKEAKEAKGNSGAVKPENVIKLSTQEKPQINLQSSKVEIEYTPTLKQKRDSSTNYDELVNSLKEGDWLEIRLKQNKKIKAKISWINPITGKYLFVDLNGLKVTDKTKEELRQSLENKSITTL